jgi:outer membrane protein
MNKLFLTAGVSLLSIHIHAVDLDRVYQDALMNDPQFSAEAAGVEAGREAVNQGRAGLLPKLNLNASYGQSHSDTDLSKGGTNANTSSKFGTDQTQWKLTAVQPLIDLAAWYSYKSSEASSRESDYSLEQSRQNLILRTAEAYLSILRAYDNLQAVKARVEAVQRQLEQTKQRFDVGLIAVTEVHETQAVYDSAQVDLISAESTLDIAFESLAQLTGKRYDSINLMSADIPMKGMNEYPKSKWEENALEANLDLKISAQRLQAAQASHQAAKAGHYPNVSLSANYGQVDSDYSKAQSGYKRNENEAYGWSLNLSLPLYAGGSTSSLSKQAYYQSQAAEMTLESTQRSVLVKVRSLYRTIESDIQRVKARQQSIVSSRSALEATQAGYEAGTRNIVEVLEAQQSLYQAEGNYANARYDYVLNVLKFKQVVGMLNATDIATLNAWLSTNKTLSSR